MGLNYPILYGSKFINLCRVNYKERFLTKAWCVFVLAGLIRPIECYITSLSSLFHSTCGISSPHGFTQIHIASIHCPKKLQRTKLNMLICTKHNIEYGQMNLNRFSSMKRYMSYSNNEKSMMNSVTIKEFPNFDLLPEETLYILDGTSMFFNSYFSNEGQQLYKDAKFSKNFSSSLMKYSQSIIYNRPFKSTTVNSSSETIYDSDSLIPSGALIALTAQFTRFIKDVKPRYLVAAFDTGNKTFRHDVYPRYKSHRPEVSKSLL